jgi:DNA/RNA-binding domain of Phe-tRNA-synthetase-like protein
MLTIQVSDEWRNTHPGAQIGLLEISGVDNSRPAPVLIQEKQSIEQRLRERYGGISRNDLLGIPVMGAYHRYYRKFGYSYHVLLQLESLVNKGKSLPEVSPLVDANFAAELETLILTAGHDAALLEEPLMIDIAKEGDEFIQMGGQPKKIPAGDMVMKDAHGIICSILRGQDNHSFISRDTTHVLYVSYVPDGVTSDQVLAQLSTIEKYVRLFSQDCVVQGSLILHT